jgi:hypothetical protein
MPRKLSELEVITKFISVHGNRYDFSKFRYEGDSTKGIVLCPKHGEFLATPNNLKNGMGCYFCAKEKIGNGNIISFSECISQIEKNQGIRYSFIEDTYRGTSKLMDMVCPEHGLFKRKPIYLITTMYGCPHCISKISLGEKRVYSFLKTRGYNFSTQKRFSDCKNIYPLSFDFAISSDTGEINLLIEYDGKQHYHPIAFHKNATVEEKENLFEYNNLRDGIKNSFCKERNIPLIRVPYSETNVEVFLEERLKSYGY